MFWSDLNSWTFFCILFGLYLFFTLAQMIVGQKVVYKSIIERKLGLLQLKTVPTAREFYFVIKGLYAQPANRSAAAVTALKRQLIFDCLCIPFRYGCLFVLCWLVALKMPYDVYVKLFIGLALAQIPCALCHISENIYIGKKIKPNIFIPPIIVYSFYLQLFFVRWVVMTVALACSMSAIGYFLLKSNFYPSSTTYFIVILAEAIIFYFLKRVFA